jgi:hypothetical protein
VYHSNPGKYALVSYDFVCSIRRLDDLDTLHLACINQVVRLTHMLQPSLSLFRFCKSDNLHPPGSINDIRFVGDGVREYTEESINEF